ncbi:hypothetical protein EDO6_02734 [Paenibacillus xylanexedens]|nr:hypothetical protein EDO6_02734 [Paenibacillus xylanexedens]
MRQDPWYRAERSEVFPFWLYFSNELVPVGHPADIHETQGCGFPGYFFAPTESLRSSLRILSNHPSPKPLLEEQQSGVYLLRSLRRGYSSQTYPPSTICPYPICRLLCVTQNIHIDRKIVAVFPGKSICDEHLQVCSHTKRSITMEYGN